MNAHNLLGLLLLAIVVLVSCAPPNHHHNRNGTKVHREHHKTLQVERVKVPEQIRRQLINQHAKTNSRFANSLKAFEHFKTSSRADASTTLPLENYYGWIFIANITVGTPPQTLRAFLSDEHDLYVIGAGAVPANDSVVVGASSSASYSVELSSSEERNATANATSSFSRVASRNNSVVVGTSSSSSAAYSVELSSSEERNATANATSSFSRAAFGEDARTKNNTYDSSVSSTSSTSGQNFSGSWPTSDIGVVVSDVVNIAGLDVKLKIGDLSVYDWFLQVIPAEGVIGLSPNPSVNNISNLLEQLAAQLSQPTVVLNTHLDFEAAVDNTDDPSERNELVLGTTSNIAGCGDSDFEFLPAGSASNSRRDAFDVVSASIAGSGKSLALAPSNGSRTASVSNGFSVSYVSNELGALLVEASGAKLNTTSGWYTLPNTDISQAKTVQLAIKGGGTINLQPADYLLEYHGNAYLYIYAFFNETDPKFANFEIALGQQYVNNHCVAYNIEDKSLGVTNNVVVSPATATGDSASLAQAISKKAGAAYAEAKLAFGLGGRRV